MIKLFPVLVALLFVFPAIAQESQQEILPVRGLCIGAPSSEDLDLFLKFIREDLNEMNVNTLVLRIDFNYAFKSHPELQEDDPLSEKEVKKIVAECKNAGIHIIPQINLLGHQSWHETMNLLLEKYPEFDETPSIKMPDKYVWPNKDGLYCKSYCPLHPEVHKVVFDLMDEIMEAFETDAFHAGMDEVFYIGDDECPRCSGRDKAELFAGEVWKIRNHLASENKKLWIWGDRLLDGKLTGMGMWEASMNNTARAIDLVPKDIVICDWHYEKPVPTAPYFAMKGMDVISCPYKKANVALGQLREMKNFRKNSTPEMASHFQGVMQTVWSDAGTFLNKWYDKKTDPQEESTENCFRVLFNELNN
jgi:N-acetyl-beta-hexosaminidase